MVVTELAHYSMVMALLGTFVVVRNPSPTAAAVVTAAVPTLVAPSADEPPPSSSSSSSSSSSPPPPRQQQQQQPADDGKRSRSLFRSPPIPYRLGAGVDLYGDTTMDDFPMYLQQQQQQQQQQHQQEQHTDEGSMDEGYMDEDVLRTDGGDDAMAVDQDLRLSSRARPAGNKPDDSPIYYIRLPPQPYMYVPGYGYVSQPTRLEPPPFAQRPHSPFLNVPLGYVSNAKPVGVYTLPQHHPYHQQHQQQQFSSGRPKPYKRPQQPTTTFDPPVPQQQPDSTVYNLDKGPYVFNGRPTDVFLLQTAYDNLYSEVLQNIYP